jgi:hypothetical protein
MNIVKNFLCILTRSGVEIWIEEERIKSLKEELVSLRESKFLKIDEQYVNTADIVGIFTPDTMASMRRRQKGEWQCDKGVWHQRNETCFCNRPPGR